MDARASHMPRQSHMRSSHNHHNPGGNRTSHNSHSRGSKNRNSHNMPSNTRPSHMGGPPRSSKMGGPSRPSHAPPGHGQPEDPNKPKLLKGTRRGRRDHHAKVRVHLPPIESYERELEYPAEAPGRVVVRLERLMGTDRVRLTDTKYMSTLLERLEEQERNAWTKRRLARIKDEKNRFRKLAIDGLMEPGPDMQDLLQHPVFRVNRVLKDLSKMDTNITLTPTSKLPPIIEVDPFLDDDSGAAFKSYPGHNPSEFRSGGLSFSEGGRRSTTNQYGRKSGAKKPPPDVTASYFAATEGADAEGGEKGSAKPSVVRLDVPEGEQQEESHKKYRATSYQVDTPDQFFDESSHHKPIRQKSRTFDSSSAILPRHLSEESFPELSELLEQYGLPPDTYLDDGEPWRSYLVDALFRDDAQEGVEKMAEGIEKMYDMGEAILGVYEREVMVGEDFQSELNKIMRGGT